MKMCLLPRVGIPFGLCGMSEDAIVIPREFLAIVGRKVEDREETARTLVDRPPAFRVTSRAARATSTLELDMMEQSKVNA